MTVSEYDNACTCCELRASILTPKVPSGAVVAGETVTVTEHGFPRDGTQGFGAYTTLAVVSAGSPFTETTTFSPAAETEVIVKEIAMLVPCSTVPAHEVPDAHGGTG